MAAISTWSTSAASNNSASPDGAPEGWAPSEVNAWGREVMAAVRTWYEDAEWINFGHTLSYIGGQQFGTSAGDGDTTGVYSVGRRVRAHVTIGGPYYGKITASSHSTTTTVTILFDSGALDATLSAIWVGSATAINPSIDISAVSGAVSSGTLDAPSGTRMLFQQTAAPTGWTKDTTAAISDISLRLTTGTVTNSTGNDKFSTVFGTGKVTGSTTLTSAQSGLPAHTHAGNIVNGSTNVIGSGNTAWSGDGGTFLTITANAAANAASGHTHTRGSMNLDYYEASIASKD